MEIIPFIPDWKRVEWILGTFWFESAPRVRSSGLKETPEPGALNESQHHGRLLLVWQRQLSRLQRLEHHEQRPLVVSLHVGRHHPRHRLRQHAAHRVGVCAPISAVHLKLLPGVFVPV